MNGVALMLVILSSAGGLSKAGTTNQIGEDEVRSFAASGNCIAAPARVSGTA
jgi:hypothetical protein